MDDCELLRVPEGLERSERRVQAEEAVEVDDGVLARLARLVNRDLRSKLVVISLAVRHDHVEAVHRAALEYRDQSLATTVRRNRHALREGRALQKRRRAADESHARQRDAALLQE